MQTIIISGSPATGKKTLANKLSSKLKYKILDLKPIIKKLSEKYDYQKRCYVVEVKRLNQEIIKHIKKSKDNLIISSHLIHNLPAKYVDLCIIVKCSDLKKLKQRLIARKYHQKKIEENIECEIFDVCLEQAQNKKHKILIVDTNKKVEINALVNKIKRIIIK